MLTRDAEHVYRLDGVEIPGITQILRSIGAFPDYSHAESARERGDEVHWATRLLDKGKLRPADLEDLPSAGLVKSYLAWREASVEQILEVEEYRANESQWYAGEPDRLMLLRGRSVPYIIDLKTGQRYRWHRLQTAAQRGLFGDEYPAVGRGALYLHADGAPAFLQPHEERKDFLIWDSIVATYHWLHDSGS